MMVKPMRISLFLSIPLSLLLLFKLLINLLLKINLETLSNPLNVLLLNSLFECSLSFRWQGLFNSRAVVIVRIIHAHLLLYYDTRDYFGWYFQHLNYAGSLLRYSRLLNNTIIIIFCEVFSTAVLRTNSNIIIIISFSSPITSGYHQ